MSTERAISLTIKQQQSIAIIHEGKSTSDLAVVIVVGGPQYRIGSHRQFIQLARFLANNGITCLRFDSRGMGDSSGDKQPFDDINLDINVAINALQNEVSSIKRVVLWGLCDAASASLMYASHDQRICGLVLLNPWLENDQAMVKTMIKHYYFQRLLSKSFWRKLFKGKVNLIASANDTKNLVKDSLSKGDIDNSSYQMRMLSALNQFTGEICLITSGRDLTAQEFLSQVRGNAAWHKLLEPFVIHHHFPMADHTFSTLEYKQQVAESTLMFIKGNI
jgi:uncharacterized protein